MCKPVSEGGQRCAAHTRPAYQAATPGTSAWDDAAAAYASTPAGSVDLHTELARVSEAHTKALLDASAIREFAHSGYTRGWTDEAADEEKANADGYLRTARGLENALKRGASLRERSAEVKAAIQLLTPNRHPAATTPVVASVHDERQRKAEEVIFLINHGYTADAKAELRGFAAQFGEATEAAAEAPETVSRFGKRKQAAEKEQQERQTHAAKVITLIGQGHVDDARHEARRFAERFGTGYDPEMAGSMSRSPR